MRHSTNHFLYILFKKSKVKRCRSRVWESNTCFQASAIAARRTLLLSYLVVQPLGRPTDHQTNFIIHNKLNKVLRS